ncbi:protein translocase subunit SecD [bacterium]|nr:protein translocase subunit SecD [bacterium]
MSRKSYKILGIFFILLGIFLGFFVYPQPFNKSVDWINQKMGWHLPHFWQVPFKLGLDLKGGVELLYEADFSQVETKDYTSVMEGLRDVIERRINIFGVREPQIEVVVVKNHYRLSVKLPGVTDPQQAIKEIGRTPFLEFREPKPNYQEIQEKNRKFFETGEGSYEDPFQPTALTGKYLVGAELGFRQKIMEPLVLLRFNDEGAKLFAEITERNIGKPLAIYIDNVLISAPVVQEKITGGRAQITGKFTIEEAKELVRNLNAGALPVPINLISQKTIGPTLGNISLQKSLRAGFIGFLAIIIFLIGFYRLPGFLSVIALAIYVVIVLSLFKTIPVVLTLSGIGGFILSIGMAVDANILIFARMREELREGKDLSQAIDEGFSRAWPSIRDANLTTLIVAVILFSVGTSFIKGFATTLIIGILVSIFSAMVITKSFFVLFSSWRRLEKIKCLWR